MSIAAKFCTCEEGDIKLKEESSMQSLAGWQHFQEGQTTYIIKKCSDQDVFKVVVSDFTHVWVKESTEEEILKIFQEMNPLIECKDTAIVQKIWSLVDTYLDKKQVTSSSSSLEVILVEDTMTMLLKFRTVMDGHRFKLHLKLSPGNPHEFFKEVTLPFLSMAEELFMRQNTLCSLLEKKDLEIAQYQIEGASLQRRSVETQPFSKGDFLAKPHGQISISNPCLGIIKILDAANLLSKPHSELCNTIDSVIDQPVCIQQQDGNQVSFHANQSTGILNKEENSKVEVKTEEEEDSTSGATQTVNTESNIVRVPKKKRPKLNL